MPRSGYDEIASEYYAAEHATSRNFDHATVQALQQHPFVFPDGLILELGAGRGRATEYLGIDQARIVQLDNSPNMFNVAPREPCLLKLLADACKIPLVSQQFTAILGFLADPFMGLDFLAEAYRLLVNQGRLLLTVPTFEWGEALRRQLGMDKLTTRFKVIGTERVVVLPSVLHPPARIFEMLEMIGFREIEIRDHLLPANEPTVSDDITTACRVLGKGVAELPIIHSIRATR